VKWGGGAVDIAEQIEKRDNFGSGKGNVRDHMDGFLEEIHRAIPVAMLDMTHIQNSTGDFRKLSSEESFCFRLMRGGELMSRGRTKIHEECTEALERGEPVPAGLQLAFKNHREILEIEGRDYICHRCGFQPGAIGALSN
jgi:hypothetical protein